MDFDDVFSRVSNVLREHNLSWLLEDVEETIRRGKTIKKEVDVSPQVLETISGFRPRRRRRQELTTTEEYNPAERLELLLNAIQGALAGHFSYAGVIWDNLPGETCSDITFRPDEVVPENRTVG